MKSSQRKARSRDGYAFISVGDGARKFMPCHFLGAAVDPDGHATYLLEYLASDGSWVAARSDRFYASEPAARVIAKHTGPEDLRPAAENLENEIASGRLSYQVWVKAVLGQRVTKPRISEPHYES